MTHRPQDSDLLKALAEAGYRIDTARLMTRAQGLPPGTCGTGRKWNAQLSATRTALGQLDRRGLVTRERSGNAILWTITNAGRAWLLAREVAAAIPLDRTVPVFSPDAVATASTHEGGAA